MSHSERLVIDPERISYYDVWFNKGITRNRMSGICAPGRDQQEGEIFIYSCSLPARLEDAKAHVKKVSSQVGTLIVVGPDIDGGKSIRSRKAHFNHNNLGGWMSCYPLAYRRALKEFLEGERNV